MDSAKKSYKSRDQENAQLIDTQIEDKIGKLGLELSVVERHAQLILSCLSNGEKPEFRIFDTCRLDNGGILKLSDIVAIFGLGKNQSKDMKTGGYIGFVPAAGAASRYTQPFFKVIQALEQRISCEFKEGDFVSFHGTLQNAVSLGACDWPIPNGLKQLLNSSVEKLRNLSPDECKDIVAELYLPKALYPCVREQFSFIEFKDLEHKLNSHLDGQVFVTPPSMSRVFEMHLERSELTAFLSIKEPSALPTVFVEQGPKLSTIRFLPDGRPFLDSNDHLAMVPAGHGALSELFDNLRHHFPASDSLLIRNIDNVNGVSKNVLLETDSFLACHRQILNCLKRIRGFLKEGQVDEAAQLAMPLKTLLAPAAPTFVTEGLAQLADQKSSPEGFLWSILLGVFHTPLPPSLNRETLLHAWSRPFNLMGQVPNTQNDIGGTPCFVFHKESVHKLCIEVPHVTVEDQDNFLKNPQKATHFNPVFVAAELPEEDHYYRNRNHDFWLLAQKDFKGQKVMYVETVLYELLGNSELANCLFVEIPRILFNPHKTPQDGAFKTTLSWT